MLKNPKWRFLNAMVPLTKSYKIALMKGLWIAARQRLFQEMVPLLAPMVALGSAHVK